ALTTLSQATYLGGSGQGEFGEDVARAIAIHPTSGEVVVAGFTSSEDFPATEGGAQPAKGGEFDAFVARLTPDLMAPVVNDLITLSHVSTSFKAAPIEGGPAGTYTIRATFKSICSTPIDHPAFNATQLSGGNLLLNAVYPPGA